MPHGRRIALIIIGAAIVGFSIFQLIPAGSISSEFIRTNPPVQTRIAWNSPSTEQLVRSACYDCHSNETAWPWYAQVAPVSWLLAKNVNEGREALDFSEQTADQIAPEELIEEVEEGEMPPSSYLILHPDANLSDGQKQELAAGLQASLHRVESDGDEDRKGGEEDD